MSLSPEDLLGQTVGPYTIDLLIGEGGVAWVFSGHRTDDAGRVALKILRPRYAADPQFETRFRNEHEVASQLLHPNIIRILDVRRDRNMTYFSMDLHPETLADRVDRDGPLSETALVALAVDIANALAFAHDAGVIHRDIKAGNILLAEDETAVLTDFGIARTVSGYARATGVHMTIGTPHYIAPEQAQGRTLDGRADLYAFGVTLYKAATGSLPFRSTDWFELARMHVEDPPEAPRTRAPNLSARMNRIILKLMSKEPDDRYPSAQVVLEEMEQVTDASRPTGSFGRPSLEMGELRDESRKPSWRRYLAAAAAILAVLLIMLLL